MAVTREATPVADATVPPEALYSKLSPGPPGPRMSAEQVLAHQRSRLLGSMSEIAGGRGYSSVTVRELSKLAGVSTKAFYENFRDKEDCSLKAIDLAQQRAISRITSAQTGERDWEERLRLAFRALAQEIADKPQAARLVLFEPYAISPAARERASRIDSVFESMLAESFRRASDRVETPSLLVKGIVAGISRVTRALLLSDRQSALPGLSDELLQWALSYRDMAANELASLDRRSLQLSAHRHRLTQESTLNGSTNGAHPHEDDRDLIITAVTKLAASEGFAQLTVPRVRVAAGVSRKRFDEHFRGVGDCFLAALESQAAAVLERTAAQSPGEDWEGSVYHTIAALCTRIACDPRLAKLAFIEVVETGPEGMRRREEIIGAATEFFIGQAPRSQRPSALAAEASVGAVWGVLHHFVNSGRAQDLPRIAATLSFLALAPAVGAETATRAIRREQERG